MAARTPRRSFATPFVVTLAAAPACYTSTAPPPQEPAPQPQPAPAPVATDPPPPVVTNPPRPVPQQQQPQQQSQWTVFKGKDGCMAAVKVQCPPKATCNPPPPFKYACPEGVSLDKPITIASSADGASCFVQYDMPKCPPNTMCNPPPPRQVTCPKP